MGGLRWHPQGQTGSRRGWGSGSARVWRRRYRWRRWTVWRALGSGAKWRRRRVVGVVALRLPRARAA
ncbi:MAG: hypothetical protein AVDCRST_MAG88-122 [uncultured Thermomicrobiales bacterium]|uniref:Uncharacterized protein n=1 Tax=uncultured Thermomicrobiales bacterium TaxID=1645740 RepID=A0A6J4U7E4_9BACT|nr:MAG: hypothetical protein AVDCRST_MAG88-122 [uncultured Thermomicrobiales bacterium]